MERRARGREREKKKKKEEEEEGEGEEEEEEGEGEVEKNSGLAQVIPIKTRSVAGFRAMVLSFRTQHQHC
jgi:hypothetical protein